MTSSAAATTDRSDFRHVLVSGTKVGAVTGVAVVAYLVVTRFLPPGVPRDAILSLLVLGTGALVSLLPGEWAAARNTEGVAGAAAIGLWGSIAFMAIDIILLRPFKAYPWTWDAIGGGSSWWYLPIWWMLGTFLAWMGGMLTAGRHARGPTTLAGTAMPVVIGAVALTTVGKLAGAPATLPVLAGAGYMVSLAVLALVSLRKS
jgi:hypothetical protein